MAQKSILVADDDASIRSLLKQLLTDEGYSITEAATGAEVIEAPPDALPAACVGAYLRAKARARV